MERNNAPRLSYIVQGTTTWLDAHPANYPKQAPKNSCIGSLVNEPSRDEVVNSCLHLQPKSTATNDMPKYPFVNKYPYDVVAVQTLTTIKAGDELLIDYRIDDQHRQARGHTVFGSATYMRGGIKPHSAFMHTTRKASAN